MHYKNVQESGQNADACHRGKPHRRRRHAGEHEEVLEEMQELASYQELAKNVQQMINETETAKQKAQKESVDQLKKLNLLD